MMDILMQYFEESLIRIFISILLDRTILILYNSPITLLIGSYPPGLKKEWRPSKNKYYNKTDDSPLYAAALILHPNRRLKYIRANWKPRWQKPVLKKVKDLWVSYREKASPPFISPVYEQRPSQDKDLDKFDRIAQSLGKYTRPASQDEYEDYCNGEPHAYGIGKMSALEWWCED